MSNFSIEAVETLDYDFTTFPSNSGSGNCKGKGTIPEPSQPRLEAYAKAMRELFDVKETKEVGKKLDEATKQAANDAEQKERSEKLLAITAELCQNTPSKKDLEELPPRILRAFMKWVFKELSDPGSFERRYEALTENRKANYYLLRRHLYFTTEEVDEMPWWKLRAYVEGLHHEFPPPEDGGEDDDSFVSDDASDFGLTPESIA